MSTSTPTPPVSGRRVLVTGAGRGIGKAIALAFAGPGARIVCAARTRAQLEDTASDIRERGGEALALPMDVTDLASVETGIHESLAFTDGAFDLVVNNAGVFSIVPFEEMSPATWYRMLAVNLNGPFHVALLALNGLARGTRPHLVNISSVAGRQPFPGSSAYCTTKYGLRGFGDVLRLEWAERGIRVSTVYPGATDTPIWDGVPGEWDRDQMASAEDVAAVVRGAHFAPDDVDVSDLEVPDPRVERYGLPTG